MQKLLIKWQNRLRLTDWRIQLNTDCHPENLTLPDVAGEVHIREVTKQAVINLIGVEHWPAGWEPPDFEQVLVHELLHLKLNLIQAVDNDLQERYVHQLIDDLAWALVAADRNQ